MLINTYFFNIFLLVLWFLVAVFDYGLFSYYWQLKWYRLDRFKDFLSTKQGRDFVRGYVLLWRSIIALGLFLYPFNDFERLKLILSVFLFVELIRNLFNFKRHWFVRPRITLKIALINLLSFSIEVLILTLTKDLSILFLLLIIRFLLLSAIVVFIDKLTELIKKYYFYLARKKISKYKDLIVIGITGSYGKTTVKEFVSQILSIKMNVVKTPENINSDIGISKFILNTDFNGVDVFVVEIGAYNVGDVKLVCDIVKPKIGILTAINEQHLALFGSIKNIQKTKYELLLSLPKDGLAIVNSDNKYCREYLNKIKAPVKLFGKEEVYNPDCLLTDVHTNKEGHVVSMLIIKDKIGTNDKGEKGRPLISNIVGEHNIMNIAPAILVALHLGLSREEVIKACSNLHLPAKSLEIYKYGKAIIIDDSYNSNPDGFKAALDLLGNFSSNLKKIVITRGMLELGEKSEELHEKIAGEISFYANELIIISKNYIKAFEKGIVEKYNINLKVKDDPDELLKYIQDLKNKNCVVLLENKIFPNVVNELKRNKTNYNYDI